MRCRPTFDQLAYTPDLGEQLTVPQALALLDRSRQQAATLARSVADELVRRNLAPVGPETPLAFRTPAELVEAHGRTGGADWLFCIGTVDYHNPNIGSALSVAVQWWWEDESLHVGWWLVRPVPAWDR